MTDKSRTPVWTCNIFTHKGTMPTFNCTPGIKVKGSNLLAATSLRLYGLNLKKKNGNIMGVKDTTQRWFCDSVAGESGYEVTCREIDTRNNCLSRKKITGKSLVIAANRVPLVKRYELDKINSIIDENKSCPKYDDEIA